MIEVTTKRTVVDLVKLTEEEAREATRGYIREAILKQNYINKDGMLADWIDHPHGHGSEKVIGEPTELQKHAWNFLLELGKQ